MPESLYSPNNKQYIGRDNQWNKKFPILSQWDRQESPMTLVARDTPCRVVTKNEDGMVNITDAKQSIYLQAR